MKRFLAIFFSLFSVLCVYAQVENSVIIDQKSFRPVQTDALTGANIDPIGVDSSRRPCARIKVKINRMTREDIDKIDVKIITNNQLAKCKTAEYENGLILEMTAKPATRFYFNHPEFGQSNEVTLNLDSDKEYYMEASLNQTFSIVVDSNVVGAEVYLDGVFGGRTDDNFRCTIADVMIGSHILKITYGKVSHEQAIEVNKNSISFRQNVNTEASKPQYVVFAVEPQSAVVTIGNTPYSLTEGSMMTVLESGTYNYVVAAAGYHSQRGTFTVAGEKVEKIVSLKADAAKVTLTAPNGADIWVNGSKKGSGSWSGILTSGVYIFEARKAGHRPATMSQKITSDNPTQSYTLPAPIPMVGTLTVGSTPLMADVTVDGKAVGRTPLDINDLLVGEHKVTVSKQGYAPYTKTITVAGNKTATITATLTKGGSNTNIGNIEMVYVSGGTFTMGGTSEQGEDAESYEKPTHSVTLSDYYIGKYEVTQAQWRAVMGSNPSHFTGDNLPVEKVSWNDIQDFITKLNAQTGKNYRLPTEAEWEYAARGGNKSKGYKYSGSNTIDDVAWYTDNSSSKTHPVGTKQPNELGIYDMSGNVFEWCQDWYGSYSSSSQTNPTGPSRGSRPVLRGGSWYYFADYCRVSFRNYYTPDYRSNGNGFRLACSPEY